MSFMSDTYEHKMRVQIIMNQLSREFMKRGRTHDNSKLKSPEKEAYEEMHEKLKNAKIGTPQYDDIMQGNVAVGLHYKNNDHHPQHFEHGIFDMNLVQIMDMLTDWVAASDAKRTNVVELLPTLMEQNGIPENYYMVFKNTLEYLVPMLTSKGGNPNGVQK